MLLVLPERLFGAPALGYVAEGDDRPDGLAVLPDRDADVLDGEAGAVLAPEDVVARGMDLAPSRRAAWTGQSS